MSVEAGKGDTYRPVDGERYRDEWERIFNTMTKEDVKKVIEWVLFHMNTDGIYEGSETESAEMFAEECFNAIK